MAIEFGRGAFENPIDPTHGDGVDSTIVVITSSEHVEVVRIALDRCRERWWGIDGTGRHHDSDDEAFWAAQPDNSGPEWHTAKYVSDVNVDSDGVTVDVDCKGMMPAAMRAAYREVLVEELMAAGVQDAFVRSAYESDYEAVPEPPTGSWPLYTDLEPPGLPPGALPGRPVHQELRERRDFKNWFLQRRFSAVWEASAAAVTTCGEEEAVLRACRGFDDAGWTVGEPQATHDWEHMPLTVAAMARGAGLSLSCCAQPRVSLAGEGSRCLPMRRAWWSSLRTTTWTHPTRSPRIAATG